MAWDDLPAVERELAGALQAFDWARSRQIVEALVERIRGSAEPFPLAYVNRLLRRLRRKRRFADIMALAEALFAAGQAPARAQRHYAQALIDLGKLDGAESRLKTLTGDPATPEDERAEARGLLGRVAKERYLQQGGAADLERAIETYLAAYDAVSSPEDRLWPGINAAALLARATSANRPRVEKIARELLSAIDRLEEKSSGDPPAWGVATAMEAWVALGNTERAEQRAVEYAGCCDADAFEFASTLRQMEQVWQLRNSDDDPLGSRVLPVLKAALLRSQGGEVTVVPKEARRDLEKNFGADRFNTVKWYQDGLDRCRSVARIDKPSGAGHGTAWVVDSRDFFPSQPGRKLLLTNAHVVYPQPYEDAIFPEDATAGFQTSGARFQVKGVVWCSQSVDASFLELDGTPDAEPLPIYQRPVRMTMPASRVYVIGHPNGGELVFSLQDSQMVACNTELLHYRTPTEGGSSGSPVFEAVGWRVVALHHAGSETMKRLDDPAKTYEANEGIAMVCLREAAKGPGDPTA
jgi:hypothetical protein